MADDLIVVDDVEDHTSLADDSPDVYVPSGSTSAPAVSGPATRRRVASASTQAQPVATERTTRSGATKAKAQPKLKLKLSDKHSHVSGMSFLGPYDRELDSSDEDLTFEEQFILRVPPGEDCEKLRRMVSSREIPNDVWFKFKGAH
jgi:transcription initiation factor TFIID subunit 7